MTLRFRRFMIVAALSSVAACQSPRAMTDAVQEQIVLVNQGFWQSYNFPLTVCWATPGYATEKQWIHDAITNTWQSVPSARVRFAGWDDCQANASVHAKLYLQDVRPFSPYSGSVPYGITLNPTFVAFGADYCATRKQQCVTSYAVHEFGHFLGYAHEQDYFSNVDDANAAGCYNKTSDPDFLTDYNSQGLTLDRSEPYDATSVMSYCNGALNNFGTLSAGDQRGTRDFYATVKPAFHSWWAAPGGARDISVGANGDVWVLGTTPTGADGYPYKWNPTTNSWSGLADMTASRIAVAPDGTLWVVDSQNRIYHRVNNQWQQLPGGAIDIAVGSEGSVWVVGTTAATNGSGNLTYRWDGSAWQPGPNRGARRIAVDRAGNPWMVDNNGNIWRRVNMKGSGPATYDDPLGWVQVSGGGSDIGVGIDGSVWVVGAQGKAFWRNESTNAWETDNVGGGFMSIAVGPNGVPWGVNTSNVIYQMQ